jgi:hypothetical protein
MLTIQIDLNSRSYGACPWDRAQIEGKIELIPSPTRILRAILYGAFTSGIGENENIKLLLAKLANELPIYYIPEGNYIPLQKYRLEATGTEQLYQTGKMLAEPYYRYGKNEFFLVAWENIDLPLPEINLLEKCLQHCHYIGRSEHLATWKIDTQQHSFNCRPDRGGTETVQCVRSSDIGSLYLSPGLRNSKQKSHNFPGFYQATYRIDLGDRDTAVNSPSAQADAPRTERQRLRQIAFDTIVLAVSQSLPATNALYWCDLLHKALVRKSPQTDIFGNGALTIAPIYDEIGSFRKIQLYCAQGLTESHLKNIAAIDRLVGRSIANLYIEDTYRSSEQSGNTTWTSKSPFFMAFQPSLKFSRNGRVRGTGYRRLGSTEFIRNGATHQALKFFLQHCGIEERSVVYFQNGDRLIAYLQDGDRSITNGKQLASCQAIEWVDSVKWQTERFSGTKFDRLYPAAPVGYQLSIVSSLPVRGVLSIGYGKNYGLGVLCVDTLSISPVFASAMVPRTTRRLVES